ncbi:MAG: uroporphyrinogen decarboxylase family protein, partial [Chloroflexota bacterium]
GCGEASIREGGEQTMAMTSRERVLTALRHEEADRVPIDLGARHSIHVFAYRALKEHLGLAGGEEVIRSYLNHTAEPDPRLIEMFGGDVLGFQPKSEANYTFVMDRETNSYVDEWGIRYRMPPDGLYYDPSKFPLAGAETVAELERYPFPDPVDPNRMAGVTEAIQAAHKANEKAILFNAPTVGIWFLAFYLRGLEQAMVDLVLQPEMTEALAERITDWYVAYWDRALAEVGDYVDVVQMEGDLGQQNGPFFSPKVFRGMFKPRLRRVVDAIKRRTRARVLLHACGSVYWAIPDLIDIGIDILNPVQVNAADMDTARLKREFGREIVFWGGGCDTIVLQRGSPDEVEAEVERRIADLAPGGGFVFGSIHNIQANVPPENIVRMFESARKYGTYAVQAGV